MGSGLLTPLSSIFLDLPVASSSYLLKWANFDKTLRFALPLQMSRHISLHLDQECKEDWSATIGRTTSEVSLLT